MKLAVIGSRKIKDISIDGYIPNGISEIVSGGAQGIDTLAKEYSARMDIKIVEFLPQYNLYGKAAPIKRNEKIAEYADEAVVLWDGSSKGTENTIRLFEKHGKKVRLYIIK